MARSRMTRTELLQENEDLRARLEEMRDGIDEVLGLSPMDDEDDEDEDLDDEEDLEDADDEEIDDEE